MPPPEGTAGWTAPEILDESPESVRVKIDPRLADVFSFGVLIWEVVSGPGRSHPLNHLAGSAYVEALASGCRPLFTREVENLDESVLARECWQCCQISWGHIIPPTVSSVGFLVVYLLH